MKPISFHPNETLIMPPAGHEDHIDPLVALGILFPNGQKGIVSCWQPRPVESRLVFEGMPVYLGVIADAQPPVMITAIREEILPGEPSQIPIDDGQRDRPIKMARPELKMRIQALPGEQKVLIEFSDLTSYLKLQPDDAAKMAAKILEMADNARGFSKPDAPQILLP